HYLCHTDAQCTKTIAVPRPIYYATDNVAYYINSNYSEPQKIIQEENEAAFILVTQYGTRMMMIVIKNKNGLIQKRYVLKTLKEKISKKKK
ncbi:unnamed protein product, partial [Rotaria magnacalcarata]